MDGFSHDAGYKYLFSSSRIVCQLLHSFVDVPIVKDISPENLQLVDKSFVSDELLKREADVIYRVRKDGQSAYIYILLEFQSTPDKAMPVRMLNYIMMFYDMLLRNSTKDKLPAVLPLLFYSGEKDWNVPLKLEKLINRQLPRKYIPRFEYYPIMVNDYSEETLFEINNLVSAIMVMSKSSDGLMLKDKINRVGACLKREHQDDLRLFGNWFIQLLSKKEPLLEIHDISQWKDGGEMLTEAAEQLTQIWLKQGIEQGIEKGIEKGELKERHEVLIRLMDLKFGLKQEEKRMIRGIQSPEILNSALDAVVISDNKISILEILD